MPRARADSSWVSPGKKRSLTRAGVPGTAYLTRGSGRPGSPLGVLTFGAGLLSSENPAQILFERRHEFRRSQRSAGTLVCSQCLDVLLPDHTGEDTTPVRGQFGQGSDPHERVVSPSHVRSRTAPRITARCVAQPRTHGVKLNVPYSSEQVGLIEHE